MEHLADAGEWCAGARAGRPWHSGPRCSILCATYQGGMIERGADRPCRRRRPGCRIVPTRIGFAILIVAVSTYCATQAMLAVFLAECAVYTGLGAGAQQLLSSRCWWRWGAVMALLCSTLR